MQSPKYGIYVFLRWKTFWKNYFALRDDTHWKMMVYVRGSFMTISRSLTHFSFYKFCTLITIIILYLNCTCKCKKNRLVRQLLWQMSNYEQPCIFYWTICLWLYDVNSCNKNIGLAYSRLYYCEWVLWYCLIGCMSSVMFICQVFVSHILCLVRENWWSFNWICVVCQVFMLYFSIECYVKKKTIKRSTTPLIKHKWIKVANILLYYYLT